MTGVSADAASPGWVERLTVWMTPEIGHIDRQLADMEQELARLPKPAGTSSSIRRGFQSGQTSKGENIWVELTLPEPATADMIVMVPLLAKATEGQVPGFGFPRRFQLEARDANGETHILLDETADSFPNPGLLPVIAKCPPSIRISSVRLTAIEPWNRGGPQVLALAEMLVLSGNRNIALDCEVSSSSSREMPPTWSRSNLIDMATPLGLPVVAAKNDFLGWHSTVADRRDKRRSVTVELATTAEIDELRIAPTWQPKTPSNLYYGFPSRFFIETATKADFSDAVIFHDQTKHTLQTPGQNMQIFRTSPRPAKYIRATATRMRERSGDFVFALAELQAYQGAQNVALGAKVISTDSLENEEWCRKALTDGLAGAGRLLELPEWFEGLERRATLERRRSKLAEKRVKLLQAGRQHLVAGSLEATGGFGLLAGFLIWKSRRQRKLDREHHRERLARDLHDELGSNLGSIALISSFALERGTTEEQMRTDLAEIEKVARESADSMRDMVELLGGKHGGASNEWLTVMEGMARRQLRGIDLECRLPAAPMTIEPDLETRRQIYLFCKEVLHNTARHAQAEHVRFHLHPRQKGLTIEISDDGCGFDPQAAHLGHGLRNLRERAAGMDAKMELRSAPGEGTTCTLSVPKGRRWRKATTHKKR